MIALVALACDSPTASNRPSQSLVPLDFTPIPSQSLSPTLGVATPEPTEAPWPAGWDIAFCTALADATVAHELLIDIERALDDDAKDDAAGLAAELAQSAPLAATEVDELRNWEAAADVKAGLAALLDLDAQAGASYVTHFGPDGRKADLREARKVRRQVKKALPDVNADLAALAEMGVSCPGASLALETF